MLGNGRLLVLVDWFMQGSNCASNISSHGQCITEQCPWCCILYAWILWSQTVFSLPSIKLLWPFGTVFVTPKQKISTSLMALTGVPRMNVFGVDYALPARSISRQCLPEITFSPASFCHPLWDVSRIAASMANDTRLAEEGTCHPKVSQITTSLKQSGLNSNDPSAWER